MSRISILRLTLIGVVALGARASAQVPPELVAYPELILINGKVLTVDRNFTIAEAVAVRDGKVLATGTTANIKKLAGPSTKTIDLGGKTLTPGFVASDGDNAFAGGDLYKDTMVNGKVLESVRGDSVEEVIAKIKAHVANAAPGTPVYIRGPEEWIDEMSKMRLKDGDELAPNNPLMISFSSSEGFVNTAMLDAAFRAGLPRDHIGVVKDASGNPTGLLFGAALGMVGWNLRDWPELTEDIFTQQEKIINDLIGVGITTVTGHASGYTVTIMSQLYHEGRLKMRIRPDLDFARQNPLADQFLRRTPTLVNFGVGDGMIRIVGAAVGPVDGASDDGGILTNEAKLREHPIIGGSPWGRNKWTGSSFSGRHWSELTPEEKRRTEAGTLYLLRKHGWNIGGNHNMGSQATSIVIETLLAAEKQPDIKVKKMLGRNALDHNLIWDARSIELAKQMGDQLAFGLTAEVFNPRVVRGEDMLMSQYGERIGKMQPVKDLVEAGVNVHFEGASANNPPLWRLERYVTRAAGFNPRSARRAGATGALRTWAPEQAVDRKQALRMLTIAPAKFISEDAMLGSIEKGKYADFVVLDGDFMAVPDDKLDELETVMTIVGGKVVFDAASRASSNQQ